MAATYIEKDEFFQKSISDYEKSVEDFYFYLYKYISNDIEDSSIGGKIDRDAAIAISLKIKNRFIIAGQESGYNNQLKEIKNTFNKSIEFNKILQKEINDIDIDLSEFKEQMDDMYKLFKSSVSSVQIYNEYNKKIKDYILKSGITNQKISKIKDGIKNIIYFIDEKSGKKTPKAKDLLKKIYFNAIYQADGTVNAYIYNTNKFDAYLYLGNLIPTSRPQCIRWVKKGRVIKKSDVKSELEWAAKNGAGFIPGTNEQNFQIYRGGYNCRHQAIPINSKNKYDFSKDQPKIIK